MDYTSGQLFETIPGDGHIIHTISFNKKSSRYLFFEGSGNTIRCWDRKQKRQAHKLEVNLSVIRLPKNGMNSL